MFEELIGKKVKIVYDHMGTEKAVFGILRGEDDNTFKIEFNNGNIIGINKRLFIRLNEEEDRHGYQNKD